MKKLLTILLVLISFSSFAQFEAGEYINSDTVKIDGVPLLLNTFKQGNLGGAGNIFYSTGASSQPASGSVNEVIGGNLLSANYLPKWDGGKFTNSLFLENNNNCFLQNGFLLFDNGYGFKIKDNQGIVRDLFKLFIDNVIYLDNMVGDINIRTGLSYNSRIFIKNNSEFVGVNKIDPSESLDVNGNLIADVLKSRIPTGTPPLVVASTTKVDSLNAGLLDGKKASDFQLNSDTLTWDATKKDLADSSNAIRALANTKAVVSGTNNYIMKKTGDNTLGNSSIYESGGLVGVATTTPRVLFDVPYSSIIGTTDIRTDGALIINNRGTGDRYAFIDFKGDDFYNSPFRIIRYNTGQNAVTQQLHRGTGSFELRTMDAGQLRLYTKNTIAVTIDTLQNTGFGTQTPAARIHSQSTGTQARLGYDANKYTDLSTGSTGNLTIDPTGDTTKFVGAVNSTGGYFENGVKITGGGGGGISNIGITVPTGLTVSPDAIISNDTFAISLQSGYSIPTTSNQNKWTAGYNYRLIAAGATAPLYFSLSGNVLSGYLSSQLTSIGTLSNSAGLLYNNGAGSFSYKTAPSGAIVGTTDSQALTNKSVNGVTLSTGAGATNFLAGDGTYKQIAGWTTDTYGINYQSGNVGIGTVSHSTSKLHVNGSITNNGSDRAALDLTWSNGESTIVSYNTGGGDGLYANSNGVAVRGTSSTTFGGVFGGLGCKAEKFYVTENLNTAPASSTATGTTGEIRFTADYIYVCVATNTWKRTQISTW